MLEAYSRLKFLLEERGLTRAELRRRVTAQEGVVNGKTLARLADPDRPLERVDMRVMGAVCRVLGVGLGDLIAFAEPSTTPLRTLPEAKQQRLDEFMARHSESTLSPEELAALRALAQEADEIARHNAERLIEHRRWLREVGRSRQPAALG